jgi:hypothetical protein
LDELTAAPGEDEQAVAEFLADRGTAGNAGEVVLQWLRQARELRRARSRSRGLTAEQRELLGAVFTDALDWREPGGCAACDLAPGGLCAAHEADEAQCDRYRALAEHLGIEVTA